MIYCGTCQSYKNKEVTMLPGVIDDLNEIDHNMDKNIQDKIITDISLKHSLCWDSIQELIDDGVINMSDNNLLSVNNRDAID